MPLARYSIQELHEQRATALAAARAINDAAEAENRNLTAEEQANYDRHFADAGTLKDRINREEALLREERILEQSQAPAGRRAAGDNPGGSPAPETGGILACRGEVSTLSANLDDPAPLEGWPTEYRGAPLPPATHRQLRTLRAVIAQRSEMSDAELAQYRLERRALQADDDINGGITRLPMRIAAGILQAADDMTFMRRFGTLNPVGSADSLGIISYDTDVDDFSWSAEIVSAPEDTAARFGGRELKPNPLAKLLKISRTLLRVSAIPFESFMRGRLAYKLGITFEKAALTGNGSGQPLGIFTASSNGISTSRDVSTGNTTTTLEPDGWKNAKYTLKKQYRQRARALLHRDAVSMASKWKDGEGRYRLQPSLTVESSDRIDGIPVEESEYVPNTFTTGLYVGCIADLSFYWWADSLAQEVQRLEELYALTNQIGVIHRAAVDGMPVLEEAFVRLKLA